ncbi:MAG TPA: ADOP family duplicated permease, partial [Terriglobales bacterium]|nr:ADOP family duplicated permease [Terriglobales bacterium]
RPLPFPQPGRLAWIATGPRAAGVFNRGVSGAELEDWRPQLDRLFQARATVAGESGGDLATWRVAGVGVHLATREVSTGFFTVLGAHALLGRLFQPGDKAGDAAPGSGTGVVLGYDCWRREFGGDPGVIGRAMSEEDGAYPSYTVMGVLPPEFQFGAATCVWMPQPPFSAYLAGARAFRPFRVVGRLRAGVSLAQAQAAMDTIAEREASAYPQSNRGWGVRVVRLRDHVLPGGQRGLWLLWAAAACLLLIACANVATLLLARAASRQGEIAIRLALGASRRRLMAQLLAESAWLAGLGGGLGLLAGVAGLRLLRYRGSFLLPPSLLGVLLRWRPNEINAAVFGFSLLAMIVAVLLCGLAPALRATRLGGSALNHTLQGASGGSVTGRRRLPQFLMAVEVAMVVVLLASAGLLIHSFVRLAGVDPGFETGNRLSFAIELPEPPGTITLPAEAWAHWYTVLEARLRALPGVLAAGASTDLPLSVDAGGGWGGRVVAGQVLPAGSSVVSVSAGYFDAMGTPLLAGRGFNPITSRTPSAKAIILNLAMARLLFPGPDSSAAAVGKRLNAPRCGIRLGGADGACIVVGVAGDQRFSLGASAPPTFYFSMGDDVPDQATFVVRVQSDPAAILPRIRTVVANMPSPGFGKPYLLDLETMAQMRAQSVAAPRFYGWLVGMFSLLALALAAVGIYGVESYAMSRRTHEIGVRMALGASPGAVCAMVVGDAARWMVLGAAAGLALYLAMARWLSSFLFGVHPWDPATLVAAPVLLLAVAGFASYLPARRAVRIDPVEALRSE